MKSLLTFLRKNLFILGLIVTYLVCDPLLSYVNPVKNSSYFWHNDFELTQLSHPERIWEKALFGNSAVIAGYIEDESASGYVNLGLDYGRITDIYEMLKGSWAKVGSELVIAMNYLCFYDKLETNETYIWHKGFFEPYAYFQRDRFYPFITEGVKSLLSGGSFITSWNEGQQKELYYGVLDDEALAVKEAYYREHYFDLGMSEFEENFTALEGLVNYCAKNNIRLRAVWVPWSPKLEVPQIALDVISHANAVFEANGIETLDLMSAVPAGYFHDFGHMEYTTGAPYLTALLDEWL